MKKTTYTLPMRILAMLLSLVLVLSVMPRLNLRAEAVGIEATSVAADANTMDEWKDPFLPGGLPSTDYAGAIWTDKSVLSAATLAQSSLAGKVSLSDPKNFMVALSAMATNSVVVGQGSVPTDVVFVLDVSGSMNSTALTGMVTAANNAIRTMMANPENRVGVILYSDDISTILPLDHYTGATTNTVGAPTFLTYISGRDVITTGVGTYNRWDGYSITGPTNSSGQEVERRVSCSGGTYIQGGLWETLQAEHFGGVAEPTNRVPAVILMSDGAPTYVTNSFDSVQTNPPYGCGDDSYNADGFVTQLTLAYLRRQLEKQYGRALLYTVGFGLEGIDDVDQKAIATKVLNPNEAHIGIDNLWTDYLKLTAGTTMDVNLGDTNGYSNYTTKVSVKKSAETLNPKYVDRYFTAEDAATLNTAFQNIVNDIALQAGYYPTRTDDNGVNYSGFVTFSDTLGPGMEVKQMEGIYLNGQIMNGHPMAQAIFDPNSPNWVGTAEEPTPIGDEFVRAVKQRMGITAPTLEEANAIAWALIENAYNEGQLAYNADTGEYSNFIVWYGDADGNYLAPYKAAGSAPAGAEFINYCYGMLGASTAFGMESDMMYVTVQMSRRISTNQRIVTFQIPAAMLPTLTYTVNVELDDNQNIIADSATISSETVSPICLIYEVGVDDTLVTPLTVKDYGTLITEGPDAGKYYLYTNAWSAEVNKDTLKNFWANAMTYAYYEPGEENEHYYFPKDTALYNADGTAYKGTNPVADAVYFKDTVYSAKAGTETVKDGKTVYDADIATKLVKMNAADLAAAQQNSDGSWYMPEGTLYANTYNYDRAKGSNTTGTHDYVHYGIVGEVSGRSNHHYALMYQGNNGRLVYEPAQGIKLTKQIPADATDLESKSFSFTVTLSADSDNQVTVTNGSIETKELDGNKSLTVNLMAGDTVYISGLDTGATFSVVENIPDADSYLYKVTGITLDGVSVPAATGAVPAFDMTHVVFTNDDIDYSALTVSKTVQYGGGTAAVEGKLGKFDVVVTLDGYANKTVTVDGREETTDDAGKLYLTITDGQVIRIAQVPVGTAYTVTEDTADLPAGYSAVTASGTGTVQAAVTGVALVNAYNPTKITPDPAFTITGTKFVVDAKGEATSWGPNNDKTFSFRLLTWNGTAWVDVPSTDYTATKNIATKGAPTYSFTMTREFTQVGDYLYRIAEVIPENPQAGMTYDHTLHDFRVRVTDNDLDGALEMTVQAVDPTVTVTPVVGTGNAYTVSADFTNIYAPNAVAVEITATKELTGRELRDDEFTFGLVKRGGLELITVTNGKAGDVRFPALVFDAPGTYEYYLYEDKPAVSLPGVEYDAKMYRVAITVTDNDGTLEADVAITNEDSTGSYTQVVFENTYTPDPAVAGPFEATKELYNHTPGVAGPVDLSTLPFRFQFQLKATTAGTPMPEGAVNGVYTAENADDGTVTIPAITYEKAGIYTYTLTEVNSGWGGYTYDDAVYTVTVTVTDDGNGQLHIASTVFTLDGTTTVAKLAFRNDYLARSTGTIPLKGQKVFSIADKNLTRQLQDGEFTFILADSQGNELERVTNVGNTFAFTDLEFDRPGTYTYTVTELYAGTVRNGVTYDSKTHTVVIIVKDNGEGLLVPDATVNGQDVDNSWYLDDLIFTNTYDVSDVTLPLTATKSMTGRQPLHGQFQFTLTGLENAPMPAAAVDGALTVTNGYRGLVDFGSITYTAAGTYKYTVSEIKGNLGGVTYDETVYTVTVTVTDNGLGALTAAVTSVAGNEYNDLVFRNRYEAADVVEDTISANKILTNTTPGAEGPMDVAEGDFRFRFTAVTPGAPMPAGAVDGVFDLVNGPDGLIAIPAITYTAAGEYVYTLEEIPGTAPGYTYDATVYTVTVTVTDNGQGQLISTVSYGETAEIVFENEYLAQPSAPLILTGTKHLEGRPLKDGEFQFILTGPYVPGGSETVSNVGQTFTFGQLVFDTVGVYTYQVTEKAGTAGGVTYDETVYTVTVTVTDDGSGRLNAAITNVEGGENEDILFHNSYKAAPTGGVVLEASKVIDDLTAGQTLTPESGKFSFVLTDAQGNVIETVKNENGKITFAPLHFEAAGVYTYTISEVKGDLSGYGYDETVIEVTVTVTDDGEGQLVAQVTYSQDPKFVNTYEAAEAVEDTISADKTLTNTTPGAEGPMDVAEGDFRFRFTAVTPGAPMPEGAVNGIFDLVNGPDGLIAIPAITYTAAGEYVYTLEEIPGNASGYTYDATVYTVTVTVTDNGEGQLVSSVSYGETAEIIFENEYLAQSADNVVLGASKVVNDLTAGQTLTPESGKFSFVLTDAQGNVIETVKNENGKITFAPLHFEAAGVYKYTISEVKGDLPGYGYDETVIEVTVTVTDNGEGQLVVNVAYSQTPRFVNTYEAVAAEVTLTGDKTLTGGRELADGEFKFQITGEGVDETVTNDENGKITFPALTFTKAGVYTFTVTEVKGQDPQVIYDATEYLVTVTVTYENGVLTAVAAIDGGELSFTNTFVPETQVVDVEVQKILENLTPYEMGPDGFEFQLVGNGQTLTATSDADGIAKFSLSFSSAGTFTYKVTEVKGDVFGMIYDDSVQEITVTVTQDAATGELTAQVQGTLEFTNIYEDIPPKTSDDFQLTAWITVMTLTTVCLAALLIFGRKRFAR